MHISSYDNEPATVDFMHDYMKANGYELDITETRQSGKLSKRRIICQKKLIPKILHELRRMRFG